jgi:hypothetical protein
MTTHPRFSFLVPVLAALLLAACSPKYNWRDYSSADAPFRVMFPDKPATHTRKVDLDGLNLSMTMTAARVDANVFAVGSAEAPDAARAQAALAAMKTALVRNIGATVTSEKAAANSIEVDAIGTQKGAPMRLVGHFEARDKRIYQVIVMGPASELTKEDIAMFMSSFKLQ